jgi:hypothetical protein
MVHDGADGLGRRGIEESVPTAVVAWTPKINTRTGVINEPPPTPVNPTKAPTRKPESAKKGLTAWRISIVSVPW